jgi:hypothetical protein
MADTAITYIVNSQGSYEMAQKLKGRERGWLDSANNVGPIPLREIYQLIPFSAKQISLDSPFKQNFLELPI